MTCVMRIETINFATLNRGGQSVKGINDGGLYGLMKHNNREEINTSYEVKSKRATNIDTAKSKYNHYFKKLTTLKIEKLKQIPKKKLDTAGAFQVVFDFQDLPEIERAKFFNEDYSKDKAKLILAFLKEQGILEEFELLEMVLHLDEKNPHFHLCFSAFSNSKSKFAYNEFFSPIVDYEPVLDKNGNNIFKKINRGKNKGKYELDEQGEKILKTVPIRKSILQTLQNSFNDFLIKNQTPYRNKKEFTSLLQFPKSVWHKFPDDLKQKIYDIREKEKIMNMQRKKQNKNEYEKSRKELVYLFNDVIIETENIKKITNHFKTPK
ncbi:MAG: hypothetical protein PHQ70_10785 [Arcobacter sp.]|uniref:hypothetical protein n=1 Tax=Arcobacter sp. TaxID=1872629 RepID=UPI00258C3FB7|nr:hypothetical protein [Arcobacter sp.]MDD3009338.1 hypothetical protein [Arcobacter sp.]